MLPSPAIVSEQEPDSTDLLIRAITTIIWLLWPKAKEAKSHSKRHPQRLNRLSLLFMPAARASDVAAIAAVVGQSCVNVEVVQGSEEPLNGRLDAVKNHIQSVPLKATSLPVPVPLKAELVEDPLRFCFKRGIEAITPDAHGAALQRLLKNMYELAPTYPEDDSSRDPIRRYIYCFYHKKILQRLQSPIMGYEGRFMGLFLESKRRGPITQEVFKSRIPRETPRCDNVDEDWLYHRLAGRHPKEDFGPKPTDFQPYRLNLNEDQLWMLWEFFTSCVAGLEKGLIWLDQNTRGANADEYEKAVRVLDAVGNLIRTLYNFAHASPTFWSLMVEMEDILNDRMGEEKVAPSPRPWSSPSSNDDPGSAYLPKHQEGVAPSRRGSQESTHGDADVSGGSDQVGLAHESDPRSPAYPDGEDLDDVLEPEEGKGSPELSGTALKVRGWLRRVTQWFGAVSDLSKGRLALGISNKELRIHVNVAPKAVQPQRQASLRAVVDSLGGSGTPDDKLDWILTRARDMYKGQRLPENTAAYALADASVDNEALLGRWESLFPSSSVHCEALLACIMHEKQIQNVAIGVSKRCCYCCGRLLVKLGFKKDDVSDHGKVYSWPPPPGLSDDVKEHILGKLKRRLERNLGAYSAGRREADSSSGSDAGSSAMTKNREEVILMEDLLDS